MKKNFIASLLVFAIVVSLLCFSVNFAASTPFSDVPNSHWAASAIAAANQAGIMTGTGGGKFSPDGTVSLAQFTTILTRMYWPNEIPMSEATGPWYAKNEDVGYNHGLFNVLIDPDVQEQLDFGAPVTRAMMAQMVCNAMVAKGEQNVSDVQGIIQRIPDVSVSDTFAQGIAFCYNRGILQGVDKAGNFSPNATLTRAQTAMIYTRMTGAATTPPAQATETPVTETPTTTAQDLNEWGIPHFRMLEGENVQQMMDRINAATPAYKAGYLTNGKPISEENIREMAEAILEDMPEGSPWGTGSTYYYNSACGTYGGCGSYACAVSDYIFGEDAPVNRHKNFKSIKTGDIDYSKDLNNEGHAVFSIGEPSDMIEMQTSYDGVNFITMKTRIYKAIDANNDGKVSGVRDGMTIESDDMPAVKNSFIISRY